MQYRVAVYGKTELGKTKLVAAAERYGFAFVEPNRKPDVIISYGGDGTLLRSERLFPGIPKVPVRDSEVCKLCHDEPVSHILDRLHRRLYRVREAPKLEARLGAQRLLGMNDIVVRNKEPTHALRFRLWVNAKPMDGVLIGDGIVVATRIGSTGYFHSVARRTFSRGIGLAFNNLTTPVAHRVLPSNARLKLRIIRGTAHLVADNDPNVLTVREGMTITIAASRQRARIIRVQ